MNVNLFLLEVVMIVDFIWIKIRRHSISNLLELILHIDNLLNTFIVDNYDGVWIDPFESLNKWLQVVDGHQALGNDLECFLGESFFDYKFLILPVDIQIIHQIWWAQIVCRAILAHLVGPLSYSFKDFPLALPD